LKYAQELRKDAGKTKHKISFKSAIQTLKAYPVAKFAVMSIALSHMVMVSVMAMTPVHLQHLGYDVMIIGFTISLHIAGMYALSPVMGYLADKLGKIQTILFGQGLFIAALMFAGFGHEDRLMVTIGLTLLGLGWSAATVAGSALLSATLPAEEKTNVQGLSDSLMNLSGAFGGAVAGLLLASFHFEGLNAIALIPVTVVTVLIFAISKNNKLANS
jgi:MFS family permease